MGFMSETPCGIGRPANAVRCARAFGKEFATRNNKLPTRTEVEAHIPLFNSYTEQHKPNILAAAFYAAREELRRKNHQPFGMERQRALFAPLLEDMGFILSIVFAPTEDGFWFFEARWDQSETTLGSKREYTISYHGSSIEFILKKMAASAYEGRQQDPVRKTYKSIYAFSSSSPPKTSP